MYYCIHFKWAGEESEQHVIYRLMEGGAREAQDDMEEIDGE